MKKTSSYGVTVVFCDVKDCTERFNTYSCSSIALEQALHAGWVRIKRALVTNPAVQSRLLPRPDKDVDLCPKHKNPARMTGATPREVAAAWTKGK